MRADTDVEAGEKQEARNHPFWLGGAAAMMTVVITHPIDQTKIRVQTQRVRQGMVKTVSATISSEGALGLWTGLSGSLLRQLTYSAARFGIYAKLNDRDSRDGRREGEVRSRWKLVRNAAVAGAFAGVIGAPGELVLVRLSSDGIKPPSERYNYRNAIHALYLITRDEGVRRTFRGVHLTCARSVVWNSSQLSCYDVIKDKILASNYMNDGVPVHIVSAVTSGTIGVTACAPVDVIKSRVQARRSTDVTAVTTVNQSIRRDGAAVLMRGWLPAWLRMAPTTTLTFVFLEQLKRFF